MRKTSDGVALGDGGRGLLQLIDRLDGYLNSPEQIELRDELLSALRAHGAPEGDAAHRAEVIDGCIKLVEQWHDGVKNPAMWMASAAGAMTAARLLLADGVALDARPSTALDVTLTKDEAEYIAAFINDSAESDDEVARLMVGDGHAGYGLYVSDPDYPEEGAVLVKNLPAPVSGVKEDANG
jgi:hypothetical protein